MILIEVILVGCALYMLILTFKMKTSREIPSFFVNQKIDVAKAKDKEGFIDYMVPRLIVFSILLILFSGVALLSEFLVFPAFVSITVNIAYIAMLIVYAVMSVKAQNRFLQGRHDY